LSLNVLLQNKKIRQTFGGHGSLALDPPVITKLSSNRRQSTCECIYLRSFDIFCFCDLDIEPMTLILDFNLDILKV